MLGTIPHFVYKQYKNSLIKVIRSARSKHYRQILCISNKIQRKFGKRSMRSKVIPVSKHY